MAYNPKNNYKIPTGIHNPESDVSVEKNSITTIYETYKPADLSVESENNPVVDRLNIICNDIDSFRSEVIKSTPTRHNRAVFGFVTDISKLLFNSQSKISYESTVLNDLISKEGLIGAEIFGSKNDSHQRNEFFYEGSDGSNFKHWFFYQEKTTGKGLKNSKTLHYEVTPAGILLVGSGYLHQEEQNTFIFATERYYESVKQQLYSKNTGTIAA